MDASCGVLWAGASLSASGAAVFAPVELIASSCSTDRIATKSGMSCAGANGVQGGFADFG